MLAYLRLRPLRGGACPAGSETWNATSPQYLKSTVSVKSSKHNNMADVPTIRIGYVPGKSTFLRFHVKQSSTMSNFSQSILKNR